MLRGKGQRVKVLTKLPSLKKRLPPMIALGGRGICEQCRDIDTAPCVDC
jgi:hypothetical protein